MLVPARPTTATRRRRPSAGATYKEFDAPPQGVAWRDGETHSIGLLGQYELRRPAFDDLDLIVASGQGRPTSGTEVIDNFSLGENPEGVGIEIREVDRGTGHLPGPSLLTLEDGSGLAPLKTKGPRFCASLGSGDQVATNGKLLESQDSDRFFAQGPGVPYLGGFKEIPSDLPQALGTHPPSHIVNCDYRITALAPQDYANPISPSVGLGVLVSCVGDEFVEGVLRILVGLTAHEDGLGQIAYAQAHFLGWHW